ncbi:hypothetical protein EJ419_02190 [Alloscardovia theropitheci]|uniref:Uncharacterized protein n=1 Tax=Alloscardovia theropitheci TaxID=2496842 RepID=A0A4R0R0R7_9BIFI|nr:hypothetical protein [Alloscardovia theropitheci]TCD54666.1 hypothetical protein EJ419_02190 [Alloscardovia theropitheci]
MMIGCIATFSEGDEAILDSSRTVPFMLWWSVFAVVMGCVYAYFYVHQDKHVHWLEKLREQDSSAFLSFGMVFFVVAIAPMVMSLISAGIQHIMWILFTALFAGIFPVVVVDAIYGAIWVRKHPYVFADGDE